jgi:uncharacterized membrane protein
MELQYIVAAIIAAIAIWYFFIRKKTDVAPAPAEEKYTEEDYAEEYAEEDYAEEEYVDEEENSKDK